MYNVQCTHSVFKNIFFLFVKSLLKYISSNVHSSVQWTAECVAQSDIFCFSTLLLTTFCVLKSERLSSLVSVSVSVRCQTAQSSGQACLQNVSTQAWDLRNIYINGHLLLNKFSDEWYVFNLYFPIKAINNEIKKYFVISFKEREAFKKKKLHI